MPLSTRVLMCHAPIVIPAIGAARAGQCADTTRAMRAAAAHLCARRPAGLVLISPHTPRRGPAWGICEAAELSGDFERFGHPEVAVRVPGAHGLSQTLRDAARAAGLQTFAPAGDGLDHGALVPLHFLAEAGWAAPTLLLALPVPGTGSERRFGALLGAVLTAQAEPWAIVASGDMSHRLLPGAPAGYDPRAKDFDDRFVAALRAGDLEAACGIDPALRARAAEDVVDSVTVASAAQGFSGVGLRVLHYAGPFGVGYLEAVLGDDAAAGAATGTGSGRANRGVDSDPQRGEGAGACMHLGDLCLQVARGALVAALGGETYRAPPAPLGVGPRGVFVTLRDAHGALRGCVGHIEPQHASVTDEVADCAVLAATRDPRFAPIAASELSGLRIEVSLLGVPEPVASEADLDPARYGVVVRSEGRRGVLLPAIEGVQHVAQQLAIARRKAGIAPEAPAALSRFTVEKFVEPVSVRDDGGQ